MTFGAKSPISFSQNQTLPQNKNLSQNQIKNKMQTIRGTK